MFKFFAMLFGIGLVGMLGIILMFAIPIAFLIWIIYKLFNSFK